MRIIHPISSSPILTHLPLLHPGNCDGSSVSGRSPAPPSFTTSILPVYMDTKSCLAQATATDHCPDTGDMSAHGPTLTARKLAECGTLLRHDRFRPANIRPFGQPLDTIDEEEPRGGRRAKSHRRVQKIVSSVRHASSHLLSLATSLPGCGVSFHRRPRRPHRPHREAAPSPDPPMPHLLSAPRATYVLDAFMTHPLSVPSEVELPAPTAYTVTSWI